MIRPPPRSPLFPYPPLSRSEPPQGQAPASSVAFAACEQGVKAEPAGAGSEEQHEPADDRQILEELALLQAARGVSEFPVTVRDSGRDDYKQDHEQRYLARAQSRDDQNAADKFHRRTDHCPYRGLRNATACEAGGKRAERQQFLQAALDEDRPERDAPQQQDHVPPKLRGSDVGHPGLRQAGPRSRSTPRGPFPAHSVRPPRGSVRARPCRSAGSTTPRPSAARSSGRSPPVLAAPSPRSPRRGSAAADWSSAPCRWRASAARRPTIDCRNCSGVPATD